MRKMFPFPFIFFLASTVHSQVVNIESARMQSDTIGWMGSAGAGFSLTKNTQQIFSVNVDAHLQYKTKKDLWLLLGDYVFLKASDQKFISADFIHFRYNRKLNSWLRWEVFTQLQSNLITLIKWRLLTGMGPRFKLLSFKKLKLYAASLVMIEKEKEKTVPAVVHNDLRNSSYVSVTFLPTENIELSTTTYYQPLFKNFSDHRWFNQSSLTVKASRHFGIYLNWNYLYDRFPVANTPKTTYNFNSGIEFSF